MEDRFTDQTKREHALNSLGHQFEKLNSTLRSVEEDLREAKGRLARQHDQSVQNTRANNQLLMRISQDIRTPMSGIMSVTELLERTELSKQQAEYVSIVKESANVLLSVVEELIEESQKNSGLYAPIGHHEEPRYEQALQKTVLSDLRVLVINGLVGSAELIEPYATSSGIECDSVTRGATGLDKLRHAEHSGRAYDVVFVERVLPDMDAMEFLRQVYQDPHLLSVKLVLVSCFGSSGEHDLAIAEGFCAHIAKPTKQAQIINILNGLIEGLDPQSLGNTNAHAIVPALATGHRVILVAEDNPVNQKVALLQLRELGFFAEVVSNGEEAVDAAKQLTFDAILMDCQMPSVDGFEATKQIRKWESANKSDRRIPIIAMTAHALSSDKEKCMEAGMDDYLSKPVTYDKLDAVLSKWIDTDTVTVGASMMNNNAAGNQSLDFSPEINMEQTATPIDVNMLTEMLGGEETGEILLLFVTSSEELMEKIASAIDRQDLQALKEAAHTMKGACSSIGANSMWRECLELEKAAKNADWQAIPISHTALTLTFDEAKEFIQTNYAKQ